MTSAEAFPESSVLAARDSGLTNPDDWPEFKINDATVTLPNGKLNEPVSLLVASEHYPVTVTGRLEAVPKELAHTFLLSTKQRTATIEVSDVRNYAYGAYEDESVDIWAAGKAGWFILKPSKAYRAIYDQMIEAVNILYFIVDAYKTPRKTGKGRSATVLPDYTAQELFEKYAIEVIGVEKGAPEAAQKLYKHRDFLISTMMAGKEGMTWTNNPLYKHLCRKFADDAKRIRARLAGPATNGEQKQKPVSVQHTRQSSHDSTSTTSSLKRKRGRPAKYGQPEDIISIESSSTTGTTAKGVPLKPSSAKLKIEPVRPAPKTARSTRSNPVPSASETPEISESQDAQTQDTDSDAVPLGRHKRKSALRLKPNKPSKGLPRPRKAALDEDADEDELSLDHSPPSRAGKRKREARGQSTRQAKRRSSRQDVDEGISMPTSPSASEANTGSPSDVGAGAEDGETTDLAVRLLHKPAPLQEDVWVCALDGCSHKVYHASLPQSQKLIREHYELHAYDDDERVRMVKSLAAPSLPVNHLMERVKIQAKVDTFPGSSLAGTRYPEPLKQKY